MFRHSVHLGIRMASLVVALLMGSKRPLASQVVSPEAVARVFQDNGISAWVRADRLVEIRSDDLTFYIDILPYTQRIHFFAYLRCDQQATANECRAAVHSVNYANPLDWDLTDRRLVKVSGYLSYAGGVYSHTIIQSFREFIVALAVGVVQSDLVIQAKTVKA